MLKLIFLLIGVIGCLEYVFGHGMVLNPASRSSRWRFNSSAPVNWDDNQLYCGGFGVRKFSMLWIMLKDFSIFFSYLTTQAQWSINGGKCGLCGDDFRNSRPRSNEYGGRFGEGIVVANYPINGLLPVSIRITANHIGYFMFDLCKMDNEGESEECFDRYPLKLADGADRYPVRGGILGMFDMTLKLPAGLTCQHCVLRWIYVTGQIRLLETVEIEID